MDPVTKKDVNFYSVADQSNVNVMEAKYVPVDPENYDTILKLSHAHACLFQGIVVDGQKKNRESAIDMNRVCTAITIKDSGLVGGKRDVITIKGGCQYVVLENIRVDPSPSAWTDIDIGNWSDQSHDKTMGVIINKVERVDGKPIRIRVGRGDMPVVVNCKYEYLWFQSLLLKAYWWIKFAYVKLTKKT